MTVAMSVAPSAAPAHAQALRRQLRTAERLGQLDAFGLLLPLLLFIVLSFVVP